MVDKSAIIAEHTHVTGHRMHWEPMVIERQQHGGRRKVNLRWLRRNAQRTVMSKFFFCLFLPVYILQGWPDS